MNIKIYHHIAALVTSQPVKFGFLIEFMVLFFTYLESVTTPVTLVWL